MGRINELLCDYLGRPEYYADFWNGTVFRGKRKIKIWQLQRHDREYYKPKNKKGRTGNVYRDVQMYCKGAVLCPVAREMPENMKEKLDEYLARKRPKNQ